MGVGLEALEVHGHERGAEPATAVAVICDSVSRQTLYTQPPTMLRRERKEKEELVSQLKSRLFPLPKPSQSQPPPTNHPILDFTTARIFPQILIPLCIIELSHVI